MTAHRYRKTDLLNAYVINQVDRKFIACLISGTSHSDIDGTVANGTGRALVFIDQHAADERIRVEQFLKPLCLGFLESLRAGTDKGRIVEMRELSPGVPVLLTSYEASKLATGSSIQRAFQRWGFGFGDLGTVNSIADGVTQSGYVQVIVKSVPEVVADKVNRLNFQLLHFLNVNFVNSYCSETSSATWSRHIWPIPKSQRTAMMLCYPGQLKTVLSG